MRECDWVRECEGGVGCVCDDKVAAAQVLVERDAEVRGLRATVERMTSLLEEQQQEGTELVSKVAAQSAEVSHLASANTELQSRLNLAELLAEQVREGEGRGEGGGGERFQSFPAFPAVCRSPNPAP